MSYSTDNPPRRIADIGFDRSMWIYESTDAHGTVEGAGYFSDGSKHGMQVGDLLCCVKTDTSEVTWHRVTTVAAATGTGAAAQETVRAVTVSAATLA